MELRFRPKLRALQPAAVADRIRQSLFAIPFLCLLVGAGMAEVMIRLDRNEAGAWLPDAYETSAENARAVLGAIATGTITVVTLVLTLTLVAIQLAAGQLSPRTIVNFLNDRFQQATVGVVIGTATYSLLGLRALRVATDGAVSQPPDLTVLVAVLLTVLSLVMLVVSVDRTANRLAVGTIVHDLAEETCRLVKEKYAGNQGPVDQELPGLLVAEVPAEWEAKSSVSADHAGWVQHIDEEALIEALPDEAAVRLLHPVGTFVLGDMVLVELDTDDIDDERASDIRKSIVLGDHRTMQQDVSFGLVRLTDIALRALSPGVNDPNTAREVVLRMGQVIGVLQEHSLADGDSEVVGHSVVRCGLPDHDDFVHGAFDPIRRASSSQVSVLETMRRTLLVLEHENQRRSLPGSLVEIRRQRELVEQALSELAGEDGRIGSSDALPTSMP